MTASQGILPYQLAPNESYAHYNPLPPGQKARTQSDNLRNISTLLDNSATCPSAVNYAIDIANRMRRDHDFATNLQVRALLLIAAHHVINWEHREYAFVEASRMWEQQMWDLMGEGRRRSVRWQEEEGATPEWEVETDLDREEYVCREMMELSLAIADLHRKFDFPFEPWGFPRWMIGELPEEVSEEPGQWYDPDWMDGDISQYQWMYGDMPIPADEEIIAEFMSREPRRLRNRTVYSSGTSSEMMY